MIKLSNLQKVYWACSVPSSPLNNDDKGKEAEKEFSSILKEINSMPEGKRYVTFIVDRGK